MLARRDRWVEALEMFGKGRYFEAHEVFELLWRGSEGAEREFHQGWVLLAAALFHRDRGNAKGSQLCFERAGTHWGRLPRIYHDLDLGEVIEAVGQVLGREWATPELPWPGGERRGAAGQEGRGGNP